MNTVDDDAVNQRSLAILESELKRIREGALDVLRLYVQWFTWFFTLSVAVLSLVHTKAPNLALKHVRWIAGTMLIIDVIGIFVSLRIRAFLARESTRAATICTSMTEHARQLGLDVAITPGFSREIATTAITGFSVAIAVFLAAWTYLLCVGV